MPISITELEQIIHDAFPDAKIKIIDLVGDENHYSLEIEDQAFTGMSLINQHKLVKKALGTALGNNLHAITIKTITPSK